MKVVHRWLGAVGAAAIAVTLSACEDQPTSPTGAQGTRQFSQSETGNGAPSGSHFNLNIIGVERGHQKEMHANSRHTMFVELFGKCDIDLTEGDFQVLDWSCLDGDAAAFQLPDPADADSDGLLEYSVWVRALGKPGGSASMTTCFTDLGDNGGTFCNAGELVVKLNRVTGKHGPKFVDVSKKLLQVCADTDDDGTADELVPLFDDEGEDFFWHYDNDGLRLAQMRFYPIQTTTQGGACDDNDRGPHPSH